MISQNTTSTNQEKYKIVILGDAAVGKTSIVQRLINGNFDPKKQETIAIDFVKKNLIHKGHMYKLMFWDTAGQQKYQSLISSYIRDSNCVIFVFDVNSQKSFQNCFRWLRIFQENSNQDASMILIGNKTDIGSRTVRKQKSSEWAHKNNLKYLETSAKTGNGIEKIMQQITHCIDLHNKTQQSTQTGSNKSHISKLGSFANLKSNHQKNACCYI